MYAKTGTWLEVLSLAGALCLGTAANSQQPSQPQNDQQYPRVVYLGSSLTVNEVIKLSKAGVSDDAIIQQLAKAGGPSHLSSSDLARLKNAGVSDRVIATMLTGAPHAGQNPEHPNQPKPSAASAPAQATNRSATPATQQANFGSGTGSSPVPSPGPVAAEGIRNTGAVDVPSEPGFYFVAGHEHTKILGQPVTFERTGSRLVSTVTLSIKAAHDNIQLPGGHAQTVTGSEPKFVFIPSHNENQNGVTVQVVLLPAVSKLRTPQG